VELSATTSDTESIITKCHPFYSEDVQITGREKGKDKSLPRCRGYSKLYIHRRLEQGNIMASSTDCKEKEGGKNAGLKPAVSLHTDNGKQEREGKESKQLHPRSLCCSYYG
jgi:hypothetical protein